MNQPENLGIFKNASGFLSYLGRRFFQDECTRMAASLSFSSLLSMVPLLALALGVISLVPEFEELYWRHQDRIFESFLPEAGLEVHEQMTLFVENANKMSGVSSLIVVATAYLILSSVVASLNRIFRVAEPRSLLRRMAVKWMVLILGPTLIIVSIYLSSRAFAMVEWAGLKPYDESPIVSRALPFFLSAVGLMVIYMMLPARHVALRDALAGGLVAATILTLAKTGFGIYLAYFPSYEAIYGALAALPVLLVWTYVAWLAMLLGAEITAALPEWRLGRGRAAAEQGPALRLTLGLAILERLAHAAGRRRAQKERHLLQGLPATPGHLSDVLARLRRAGILRRHFRHWSLTRELSDISLGELLVALNLSWEKDETWPGFAQRAISLVLSDQESARDISLDRLLAQDRKETESSDAA